MYDVIIVGSGPAGMTAAIYAKRARLNTLLLEKNYISGGQVMNTTEVENYPGFFGISGMELAGKFREHAEKTGVTILRENVVGIVPDKDFVTVKTEENTYETRALVAAMGAGHKKLGIPGEEEFAGMGVSYCATCDGPLFRNRTVTVIGGGDTAVEEAVYLSRICEKVYLVHRRENLRAAKGVQDKLLECENIEMLLDSTPEQICGSETVESIIIRNLKDDTTKEIRTDAVFPAIGISPDSGLLKGIVEMDEAGFIKAGENGVTSCERIFAAGDIRTKELRQIVTAVSDGANAVSRIVNNII